MKLKLFIQRGCPFCTAALSYIRRAEEELGFSADIEVIDELMDPDTANAYDYYYVPTFYIGDEKVHEGAIDYQTVLKILQQIK